MDWDDLVNEIFDFEVLDVNLVGVLQFLARGTQVLLVRIALHFCVLEEDYLYVVLDYCLVVAVLRAVVLLKDAVQFILCEGLGGTEVFEVLVLLNLVNVDQFAGLIGPLLEQSFDSVHLLEVQFFEVFEFVVVEFVVSEFAAADRALEDVGLRIVHLLFEVPVDSFVFQQKEAFYLVVDLVGAGLLE